MNYFKKCENTSFHLRKPYSSTTEESRPAMVLRTISVVFFSPCASSSRWQIWQHKITSYSSPEPRGILRLRLLWPNDNELSRQQPDPCNSHVVMPARAKAGFRRALARLQSATDGMKNTVDELPHFGESHFVRGSIAYVNFTLADSGNT